ncbi:MAG TPA: hybrid sensor histidine kinase/response regulator [Candidatus Cloacimonetes bacterium]|nr:hybrid sensor histidine kinase/response regulator [Candidatus Cloacimonadota bacterium]
MPINQYMKREKEVIIIIDDQVSICDSCSQVFRKDGFQVDTATDGISGLEKVIKQRPDLVFVDLKMPGISGMEVLEEIANFDPTIVTVVITGYATIDFAVEAVKKGAFDFIPKPFIPDQLRVTTKRALERRRLLLETMSLRREKERMKENFISMVSHQLRTPLVAVQGYFEVILAGIAGDVSAEQKKMLERSKIRIDELIKLIKEWLSFARIDANSLVSELEPVDLIPLIKECLEDIQLVAEQKQIKVQLLGSDASAHVLGNKAALKQVFINLLENGIKYNKVEGSIRVSIKTENNFVNIEISDTGVGISKKDLPFIFEQFYQINKTEGSGLGLAIVKRIIDSHSGSIKVTSEPGEGTDFQIKLPQYHDDKK